MPRVTFDGRFTDASTDRLVTIDYGHHELHNGNSFSAHYFQDVTDTNDRTVIAFTTPATKEIHMVVLVSATAAADFFILEGAVGTTTGATDLTVFNRDRNSTTTSLLTSIDGTEGAVSYYTLTTDTAITGGTELYHEHIGAGRKGQAIEGASRVSAEWILKKSTVYDFELKSLDANDNSHHLECTWYELTNKAGGA